MKPLRPSSFDEAQDRSAPTGYKQTEVGVIPEEWEVKTLREVLNKGRLGGNYPNQNRETEYPLMKMGNLARGYMDTTKVEYITRGITPEGQHKLSNGDVLFNTRNTLDLVGRLSGLPRAGPAAGLGPVQALP